MAGVLVEGVELQREGDRQVVAQGGAAAQVGGLVDWYPSLAVTQSWSRYQLPWDKKATTMQFWAWTDKM